MPSSINSESWGMTLTCLYGIFCLLLRKVKKSPLECANELWESEEFAASLPDFVPLSDDETAIPNVATTPAKVSSDIYDLQGRRLTSQPSKGVFIQGGKKVVIK